MLQICKSLQAWAFFRATCNQVGISPLELLLWIRTCWGLLFSFLERFIKLKAVHLYLSQISSHYLTSWQAVIQFILLADASEAVPSLTKKHCYADFHLAPRDWECLVFISETPHLCALILCLFDVSIHHLCCSSYWMRLNFCEPQHDQQLFPNEDAPHDINLTVVNMLWGLYKWVVMPMGIKNTPSIHQCRVVTCTLRLWIGQICYVYMNNIAIWLKTLKEHTQNVTTIIQTLLKHKLYLNTKKTKLFCSEIKFLGHHISDKGVEANKGKVDHVTNWPRPSVMISPAPTQKEVWFNKQSKINNLRKCWRELAAQKQAGIEDLWMHVEDCCAEQWLWLRNAHQMIGKCNEQIINNIIQSTPKYGPTFLTKLLRWQVKTALFYWKTGNLWHNHKKIDQNSCTTWRIHNKIQH